MIDPDQSKTARSECVSTGNPQKDWAKGILFLTYILHQYFSELLQQKSKYR